MAIGSPMANVVGVADPLQIARHIVGLVAIKVVDLAVLWLRYTESLHDEMMHVVLREMVLLRELNHQVVGVLSCPPRLEHPAGENPRGATATIPLLNSVVDAADVTKVRHFVVAFVARNRTPIFKHVISLQEG